MRSVMPITRSQLLKILADDKMELEEAEASFAERAVCEADLEAEADRLLMVLRNNVQRIEKILSRSKDEK
jgi:hypothetical protein